jgi:hypothetical protein
MILEQWEDMKYFCILYCLSWNLYMLHIYSIQYFRVLILIYSKMLRQNLRYICIQIAVTHENRDHNSGEVVGSLGASENKDREFESEWPDMILRKKIAQNEDQPIFCQKIMNNLW